MAVGKRRQAGFSLAELLVVVGVLALLIAIMLPPLQMARRQAMDTQCKFNEQQLGVALFNAKTEYRFFPLWDDGGVPIRYTWIDVLTQLRLLGLAGTSSTVGGGTERVGIGYCPADAMPDPLNSARHSNLIYPPNHSFVGIDYSYGINLPLSAGAWRWSGAGVSRRFRDHEENASGRVLIADANSSAIYNLSGEASATRIWNSPTQYDNTVAWERHSTGAPYAARRANALFQDGHVGRLTYDLTSASRVNMAHSFIWRPEESVFVNPGDHFGDEWYPSEAPPNYGSTPRGSVIPDELVPAWYTSQKRWTLIPHK